jgi:hypothetical protein
MKILAVAFLALLLQGIAYSAEEDINKPPHFYLQGSVGNNSGLAMRCVGEPPFKEIDCSFTQVSISAIPSEETAKKKRQSAAETEKLTQNEIDKFGGSIDLSHVLQRMKTASIEQKAFMQDFLDVAKNMAKVKDKASYAKAQADIYDLQAATCTISVGTFDRHFTRVSPNKWLYNPGPGGLCNVVRIATLEKTPDNRTPLWTYTETVVRADQDETCKKWVEVGKTYTSSWDAPKSFKFENCKYIELGF